jgi:uncharacterized damage-inducible protein DinB
MGPGWRDSVQDLIALYRYNTWANGRVFDLAAGVENTLVQAEAPGTRDTVSGTLAHLASVEYAYLWMIEGRPPQSRDAVRAWANHELNWFVSQMRELGNAYIHLLESASRESLERPLNVPWFQFQMTAREGLLQVLSHSAQHRSQVLSWLSAQGIPTPDLDYVVMLGEQRES